MNRCGQNIYPCSFVHWVVHLLHKSSKKWLVFAYFWSSQIFYPNLQLFLHGYIRHIRDIFQLCPFTKICFSVSGQCVHEEQRRLHSSTPLLSGQCHFSNVQRDLKVARKIHLLDLRNLGFSLFGCQRLGPMIGLQSLSGCSWRWPSLSTRYDKIRNSTFSGKYQKRQRPPLTSSTNTVFYILI